MQTIDVDNEILNIYKNKKKLVLEYSNQNDPEKTMAAAYDVLLYLNRFRNCDLGIYFDEDINHAIQRLNTSKHNHQKLLVNKKKLKLLFLITNFSDTGGASIPHRFMLPEYRSDGFEFEQHVLVTNLSNIDSYEQTEGYRYLVENIKISSFKHLSKNLTWTQKASLIENWIVDNEIDFIFGATCPASIFALGSQPALVSAVMPQDCYTYTIGPGVGDLDYMVTEDQIFKYKFIKKDADITNKVILLPLHDETYVKSAVPIQLNLPAESIVSATSNMWKSLFGDGEILLELIARLIRDNPSYHHVFIGTKRCEDNLNFFLNKNPDLYNRIHFIGSVANIYSVLKSIHFWINSYPTSGGTDIEAGYIGIPSIELISNRNLNLHGAEFMNIRECSVYSSDEFLDLGNRLIKNHEYRENLGMYVKSRITREFDKKLILEDELYKNFIKIFKEKLISRSEVLPLGDERSREYEKRIALYNSHGKDNWPIKKRLIFLYEAATIEPERPFSWIKLIELITGSNDYSQLQNLVLKIPRILYKDSRILFLIADGFFKLEDKKQAEMYYKKLSKLTKVDDTILTISILNLIEMGSIDTAIKLFDKKNKLEATEMSPVESIDQWIKLPPQITPPCYYDY